MGAKPLIIILGGTYGVGKTTLAHYLGIKLNILQRAGVGGIVKSIKTISPKKNIIKEWDKYKSDKELVRKKIIRESEIIGKVIKAIAKSAVKNGENYIIDGVQILPKHLPLDLVKFLILKVSNREEHKNRFEKPDITKTKQVHNNFDLVKTIEEIILEESSPYNIATIDNIGAPSLIAEKVIKMIAMENSGRISNLQTLSFFQNLLRIWTNSRL